MGTSLREAGQALYVIPFLLKLRYARRSTFSTTETTMRGTMFFPHQIPEFIAISR